MKNGDLNDSMLGRVSGGYGFPVPQEPVYYEFTAEEAEILNEKGYNVKPGIRYTIEEIEKTKK